MANAELTKNSQSNTSLSGVGSTVEQAVAKIWADVLRLPAVRSNEDFFTLGGDSIKAIEVIAHISDDFQVELPLEAFFEDPTVAHIAAVLDEILSRPTAAHVELTKIWLEVLRLPSVATDADFFAIGGDSMKAMEVIAQVQQVLGVELPLMAFFEEPTIAHLAAVLEELTSTQAPTVPQSLVIIPGRKEFPLSYSQEVFWLLEQQNNNSGLYNTARVLRLHGNVDPFNLERALNEVRRRHEIFQVRFVLGNDGPIQIVDPGAPLTLEVIDLSHLEAAARSEAARLQTLNVVREPLDLETGPPLRARLIRLTATECILAMAIHHVVSDGFTGSILLDELRAVYDAFAADLPSPLPEVEVHFTDFAAWQRQTLTPARIEADLDYWRPTLAGVPTSVDLPVDHANSSSADREGHLRTTTLSKESLSSVQALAQANGTTLFTILNAAFRALIYRFSGQSDFLIGTLSSNRSHPRTERMIGCFVNSLPLRNPISEDQTVRDLVAREKTAVMNAFAHQDCPFPKIVEAANPERSASDNPLFNVALLYQSYPAISVQGQHWSADDANFDAEIGLLDLRFITFETSAGLKINCEFRSAVFEIETVDKLLAAYTEVLMEIAANPAMRVAEIALPQDLATRAADHARKRHRQTLTITANFTADPIVEPLAYWMDELRIPTQIELAPFDQIFQQLLDPTSLLARNADGANILFLQWREGQAPGSQARELASALKSAAARGGAPIIVCICPPEVSGEEEILAAELVGQAGVHVLYPREILSLYPVENYRDEYAEALGAIPYTLDFFVALATITARRIYSLRSSPYKVIALDCDNTLWRGVCGEEGPLGVEVDAPRLALQQFMLTQREAGMLLCLNSKNVEADVNAVFAQNPGMLLRPEHITASRINWQSKSQNLHELARQLNLGVDSIIFVDDNPIECAEVRANCPGALVLELPADPAAISGTLSHLWAFDHWSVTAEDRQRSELYRQELQREQARSTTGDLDEFLRSLELHIDIHPMQPGDLARVSQLTHRTNQFNCTTIRRSEAEITSLLEAGYECLTVNVRDRFGDYGLVGVVIFSTDPPALAVDTLLMSCRVLGRRVEHNILAHLGRIAQQSGLDRVDIAFAATAKNRPAQDFLESLQSTRNTTSFSFTTAQAIAAPEAAPSAIQNDSQTPPAPNNQAPQADLIHIATDLADVQSIAQAIRLVTRNSQVITGSSKARTAIQEIVSDIWATLLHTAAPGIHDDFFRLGGNSLLAVQVISRIRQTLGVELPLRAIFESPTLSAFAHQVEITRRSSTGTLAPPIARLEQTTQAPASFAQQRLWFLDQLEPDNPIYNIPQMTHLRGPLRIEALQLALTEIVRRHEALRTTFISSDGQPLQVIGPAKDVPLPLTDLSHLSPAECETEVQRLALAEAARPFNLATGPVFRAQLLRTAPEDHILLIVIHHIVGDRWSAGILAEEMEALYAAFVANRPSPLAEPTIQYADFSVWQRNWLQGDELARQAAYWKQQLAGAPALLEVPTDHPRPAVLSHRGATKAAILSQDLVEQLSALSQAEGVTLFMTLLAALQTLMSRYSGQDDIVVGSPIAGRNTAEVEQLIGFFVNTLALRSNLSGNPSFRDLLVRVKQITLDAYTHQDIPFERLVEEIQPERSLSYQPIFQIVFALQNAPQRSLELSGLHLQRLPLHQGTSAFDMSWFATHVAAGMEIRVEYNTDLFEAATITRAIGHFETLLESIVVDPAQHIGQLSLLPPDEAMLVSLASSGPVVQVPRDRSLHQFIEEQADKSADAPAVAFEGTTLTYKDLNERANQLAHRLRSMGVGPDVLVGVCIERSVEMVVALLATMKAGGAYVPLDPDYPQDRLGMMVSDAEAAVILTSEPLLGVLPQHTIPTICLDREWHTLATESKLNPEILTSGKNLAYVIYTSGSTGKPKGVPNVHEGIVNRLLWMQDAYRLSSADRVLQKTPYSFDVSVWEFFWPLMTGACIVVAQPGGHKDPDYLVNLIQTQHITTLHFVPSMLRIFLEADGIERCTSLSRVICSGEALPVDLETRFFERVDAELHNLYGPTEAAVDVTYWQCGPNSGRSSVPIGRAIWNTQIRILDPFLQQVPFGVPGELHIGGRQLARGYLKRPDLTTEKFIPDPFGNEQGARLYKSGDVARILPDGVVEYLGRIDHQVKVRGFRIELGEIESTLASHVAVRDNVVVAREDKPGNKYLVAYIVPHPGGAPSAADLRAYLLTSLPEYMVPQVFVTLDALPLSSNGKIDRKALPTPEISVEQAEFVAPRTATEQTLASIWSQVLHTEPIGVNANFFSLGGHSLLAAQVISRIRRAFDMELPLRELFEAPTIEDLGKRIDAAGHSSQTTQIPLISRDQPLPLSFAQQRMWFSDQLDPGNAQFNLPFASRVNSTIDPDILARAVAELVQRHEALRTNFSTVDGLPVQVIAPTQQIPIQVEDLRHVPADQRDIESQTLLAAAARRPFDLAHDSLLRILVIQLADDASILLLSIHHIISDRWSITILLNELSVLYDAFSHGKPSPLAPLPVQYADFAAWQRNAAEGEQFHKQLNYWTTQLKDAPPVIELPTDRPRPAFASVSGDVADIALSPELTATLNTLSLNNGATLYMTLLAGFEVLLARYSGLEDFVIGMPIASRGHTEIEGLIGLFANTLPLRANLSGDPNFKELLSRTKDLTLKAYANQDIPLERLVEELRPERSLSYDPLVQVHFILQNAPLEGHRSTGLHLEHFYTITKTAKGDLFFALAERNGALHGRLEYNTDLFDATTIERMLTHYRQLLDAAVANSTLPISRLPLLTSAEQDRLQADWSATTRAYPRNVSMPQLFEQQVVRSPESIACIAGEAKLTYSELNERANQLAHFLVAREIGPGTLVGICLNRTENMLVALLGVLKSGAAYLPLDPTYPQERLGYILDDAHAKLVITEEAVQQFLPAFSGESLPLDAHWSAIAQHSKENLAAAADPEDLAYVLHTSGSTGKPKGVEITHRNLVNFLTSMQQEPGLLPDDKLLAVTTLSFDIAGLELYLPLITGASVVICARPDASSPTALIELMERWGITVMQATPATWLMLFEAGWQGNRNLKVLCGGEALPQELAAKLVSGCRELWNMYGPTETTIWSSVSRIDATNVAQITIGHPIANTTMYVLDPYRQLVPLGVTGELYIGGEGVGRGYWNKPELTAERFVADPFVPGSRMYRTGDVAKFLPNGTIQCLGRIDQQVKIRGYRIELGEIESVLGKLPLVRECVVVAREDQDGEKRLVAYVIAESGSAVTAREMREWVKEALPEYMVPSAFVLLDRLPLTPNGKIDRKALPAPEVEAESAVGSMENPIEEMIANIWAEVLKTSEINQTANFFELGGHSLLATKVVARIRQAMQVNLPLGAIFESPTVGGLAARVNTLLRASTSLSETPFLPANWGNTPKPLSFSQRRLWFLDQLEPNNPFYNVPAAMRLVGAFDASAMEHALSATIARHESLRTTFALRGEEPVQIVAAEIPLPLEQIDLSSMALGLREAEAQRLVTEEARRPFDLAKGPLFRALLVKLGPEDHVFMVNLHHAISDGWSLGVLMNDLTAFYEAFRLGVPPHLPPLPLTYGDYAVWQRQHLEGGALERQLAYWKTQLAGAPPSIELPTDRTRPPVQTFHGAKRVIIFPPDLLQSLKAVSRAEGATLFITLLAAFNVLLSRYSGQKDIVVGTANAGRHHPDTERVIGYFANTVVLRNDLEGEPTFRELVHRVRETTLHAFANQDVPFERLVEELNPVRDLSRSPVFQVMIIQQNAFERSSKFGSLKAIPYSATGGTAKVDLLLNVSEDDGRLRCALEYNVDLYEAATIDRMLDNLGAILNDAVVDPAQHVSEMSLLQASQREQQLVTWNETESDYPRDKRVHQLIEEQAERTPDAVAILWLAEQMTYGELNRQANHLARYLRDQGVKPTDRVGIYLERSIALMVTLLAVQKAGATYVPLDPAYPVDRLKLVLQDADVVCVVTLQALVGGMPEYTGPILALDRAAEVVGSLDDSNIESGASPEDSAYVIFTSGSTGRPKGVEVPHRAVVNLLTWMGKELSMGPGDVFPALASFAFDMSVPELYLALVTGGTVLLAERHMGANGEALAALLKQHHATVVHATPTTWGLLLEAGFTGAGLKRCIGAEGLPRELFNRLMHAAEDTTLYNFYGPTETTVWSTFHRFTSAEEAIVIGRPLANTQVYVLEPNLQPVPVGVAGGIYISGDGVARGYFGRPELTAEKFLPNPFAAEGKLYYTGDVGRYLPDGRIEYLSRADNQVKLRGYRIELGEIEAQLSSHPLVRECVVIAREDHPGLKFLAAYVVAESLAEHLETTALRDFLKQRLPEFMVPTGWRVMDRLPLSTNGKVDRKALPAPDAIELKGNHGLVPKTSVEIRLARIWEELLQVKSIGLDDDFFNLGGHSLLAVQMMSRAREAFGCELPLHLLFGAPRLGDLAKVIQTERGKQPFKALIPIRKTGTNPPLFCVSRPNVNALGFLFLSRHLSPDQPVIGLQTQMEKDGAEWAYDQSDYEERATEYIKVMRESHPDGPYLLTGYCEGAHIAFEMARQLESMGQTVAMLAILDAWPIENTVSRTKFKLRSYLREFRKFKNKSFADIIHVFTGSLFRKLGAKSIVKVHKPVDPAEAEAAAKRAEIAKQVAKRYWPGPDFVPTMYGGRLTLFRTKKQLRVRINDYKMGWGKRALGGVDVFPVPGSHWALLREPSVIYLAQKMQECIDRSLAEHTSVKKTPEPTQATLETLQA